LQDNGNGIYVAYSSSPLIKGNTIISNGDYGIYTSQSNAIISDNRISNQGYGIRTDSQEITVSNTTIQGSSNYDYYLYYSGSINSINTTFGKSKVYFYGSGGVLNVSWHLNVKALDANANPISNANVSVYDSFDMLIFNGSTGSEGLVRNIVAREYIQTTAGKTYYTPHNISAEFNGTSNFTASNMDSSKEVPIHLAVNQPLEVRILTPANNSLFVQGDAISFNALAFDPVDGTLTGHAINWTSSIDGSIGSGESFSNSNLSIANHTITAVATNSMGSSVSDSVSIEVIGRSDLTVESINWTPSEINEGEPVTFNTTVTNIGNGYTPSQFYVRFYIDNSYLGQTLIERLNASESSLITQTWTATAYAKNITVVVDYYDHISEIDETNNIFTVPLTEVEQADLIVSSLTWEPEVFYEGMPVTFEAEIRNIGVGNASNSCDIGFYINGGKVGTVSVSSLVSGESINVSRSWNAVPGSYVLLVEVDDTNKILESNESNNSKTVDLPPVYQADLIVSNITIPTTINDGDTVIFNATVKNIGLNSTANWFGVRFYIDGSDIGYEVVDGLSAGESSNISKTWTATPGNHTLTVVADAAEWYGHPYNAYGPQVNESNETNNNKTKSLPRVEQADLTVTSLSWTPSNFTDGEIVTFNANIENTGIGNTTKLFHTRFLIDGVSIGQKSLSGLASGSSASVTHTWTATPGEHTIEAVVDPYNHVAESNETNNTLELNLTKVDRADLIVSNLTWTPSNFSDGQVVTFRASISNIDSGNTTRSFYTRFLIDDTQIGEKHIGGLPAGSSIDLVQVWPAAPGTHTIKVMVDSYNHVAESNESNNSYSADLPELEMPDLIVSNLNWTPSNFSDGQVVTFTATIKNIGSGDTTRQFYTGILNDVDCDCGSIGNVLVSGLASGEEKDVSVQWLASSGYDVVTAVVDPEGYIAESNASNNNLSHSLPPVLEPDLVITDVTWSGQNISDGDEVTFNVTIANTGVGNTSRISVVQLEINDTCQCGSCTRRMFVPGLDAGESTSVEIPYPWTASYGVHVINATADSGNIVREDNETNNQFYAHLLVDDTHPPVLSGITPANGSITGDVSNITAALSDNTGSGVDLNNSTITIKRGTDIILGITIKSQDSLVFVPDSPYDDGEHTVLITAVDNAGNSGLIRTSFTVDRTAPVITITGVSEGAYYKTSVTPVIEMTDLHLSETSITLNGLQFISGTTISTDGSYLLFAQAVDEAGNCAEKVVNFSVDAKPSPPTGLRIARQETTADLAWDPNIEPDIAGYNVYRDDVKQNGVLLTDTAYHDTNLTTDVTYLYTISAVDLAGHESDRAGVSPMRITLTEYGTLVDGVHYLTKEFADAVTVNIFNENTTQLDVESATIEVIDTVGDCTYEVHEGSFSITASSSYSLNKQVLTGNQTNRIKVVVQLTSGSQITRVFDVNVRDVPSQPVEVSAPTLLEGYRDAIDVRLTNHGSVSVSVNPQ
ncbi:MAG: hypothetical protein GWP10_20620, partial [Nitrospiraceae bacterium]|nr:hypothetical protein [Nitrospiraceae bacterium]